MGGGTGRPGCRVPSRPPRGSETVPADSPGSPGLRRQGHGPWREGRAARTAASVGSAGPAWSSRQSMAVAVSQGTCTCARVLEAPAGLGPFLPALLLLHAPRGGRGPGRGRAALGRGGLLLHTPPRPASLLPGWDCYCFGGTGKGPGLQPAGPGVPAGLSLLHSARNSGWDWDSLGEPPGRFRSRGGVRPSPAPRLVLGPHCRQPGGPGQAGKPSLAPLASQLGSTPSPKIKKYFGELKSARGRGGLAGVLAGARQRTLWSLMKAVLSPRPSSSSESDGHSCQASGGRPL